MHRRDRRSGEERVRCYERADIAVLVSGGGTNLQALIDASERRRDAGRRASRWWFPASAGRLCPRARAKRGHSHCGLPSKEAARQQAFEAELSALLREHDIELIVLAGFLCDSVPRACPRAIANRILNVHPSLIPVLLRRGLLRPARARGGAEARREGDGRDGAFRQRNSRRRAEFMLQKAVEVRDGDTPETLQRRVMEQAEWKLLPRAAGEGGRATARGRRKHMKSTV